MSKPMVFYYARNACSIAPHIALEEVGAEFEARCVDLTAGEQLSPGFLAVNPAGRVPALVMEERTVTEVPALLTYIASLKTGAGLIPAVSSIEHARCFEWLAFLSSSVHVAYAQFRRPHRFVSQDFACVHALVEQGRRNTIALYREVERRLGDEWAAGNAYSIADMYLVPFHGWSWRLDFDIEAECPKWSAIVERVLDRDAVRRVLARENSHEAEAQTVAASFAR
ncbi:glutathione S-transferase family protein [Sphingomonas hankyongi]|uniref:Glutathione binding-like protein n=1 Tax=Sphingomonas hankyongi TaxID=2908209 RepID=A0ABT0S0L2_9SPHN|nr:glutathione binding-like protein [Sphingomonas hankyongi]MCL6729382.1 glutathione binding-like protein [Sphingomonas hankyongi]